MPVEDREASTVSMLLVASLPYLEVGSVRWGFARCILGGRTLLGATRRVGISTAWVGRLQDRTPLQPEKTDNSARSSSKAVVFACGTTSRMW